MVSKVTVKENRYTNILMGTVQAAIANGVLDSVRNGDIPKERANDLGVIVSVWLNPSVSSDDNLDHKILFDIHRKATSQAIHKAKTFEFDLKGAVMASDAFFPFPDCVEIAKNAGITAVIQPGGSIKDQLSIDYCNANNVAMVFTKTRHFKH